MGHVLHFLSNQVVVSSATFQFILEFQGMYQLLKRKFIYTEASAFQLTEIGN